jgi:hypothetical protein
MWEMNSLVLVSESTAVKMLEVRVDFPTEPYGQYLGRIINPALDNYTHFAVIDDDVTVESDFYNLPARFPDADVIGVRVIPTSRVFRIWEKLTFWVRFQTRVRGCAMILRSDFLKRIGGYPKLPFACDTWLLQQSDKTTLSEVRAFHHQPFGLRGSAWRQLRDGQSRVVLGYPMWKTALHGIFRLRPLVLIAYLYYRINGIPTNAIFSRRWSERAKPSKNVLRVFSSDRPDLRTEDRENV